MNDATCLKDVDLVVVGSCNGKPWFTEYLGRLILVNEGDNLAPCLMHGNRNRDTPYRIEFARKSKGEYVFEIPGWQSTGLRIRLSTFEKKYRYVTGLHPYDSGGSGPLAFGGAEMVEIFDAVFFPENDPEVWNVFTEERLHALGAKTQMCNTVRNVTNALSVEDASSGRVYRVDCRTMKAFVAHYSTRRHLKKAARNSGCGPVGEKTVDTIVAAIRSAGLSLPY